MFPPPVSDRSIVSGDLNPLTRAYRDVAVYDGPDPDDALYEGPIVVHANGWIELEGNRLLSPSAVHHIDVYDDEFDGVGDSRGGDDPGSAGGSGDAPGSGRSDDDRRFGLR